MAALEQYHARRDFSKTREPKGRVPKAGKSKRGGLFVVQKHDATRLHYDFRLEHDGVLWSWAVTRGPSLDPSEKRLAVHVEDHPLEYGGFEGTIPAGEYGAGAVIVWDEGTWVPELDPVAAMKKGHIRFELKGSKLNGLWDLVRLKPRGNEKRDNWLLIKADDAYAKPGEDVLEDAPNSVKSGRGIEQIGEGNAPVWHSNKPAHRKAKADPATGKPGKSARTGKPAAGKTIGFVQPCLARLASSAPEGAEWLHEVKFDGYRMQAQAINGKCRLLTRTGLDWTERFAGIAEAVAGLKVDDAVLDGEIVVLGEDGVASFSALQKDLSEGRTDRMIYYVFDLLHLDGTDLTGETLVERKARLETLLADAPDEGPLRFSEHFAQTGKTMLRHACRMGLEGVVSKRADAPYRSGRGHDWVKSKCTQRQEFVILGYLPSEATGRGLRSLLVGYHENGTLKPAGRVGTGFTTRSADLIKKKLDRLKAAKAAITGVVAKTRGVIWVKPELVAEVEFRAWTADGNLRHASFQGLREDKPADEVIAERPESVDDEAPTKRSPGKPSARAKAGQGVSSTVTLTNPDKLLWPKAGLTKQGLLDYYAEVWPRMEPFVVDRPLSLVRAPDGVEGKQRFFQKHASPGMDEAIAAPKDPQDGESLLTINSFDGLAALVQLGVVEVHLWGCTADDLERPDQIVFDLDPDEGLGADDVREAALDVRRRLDEIGLPNVVKVSGGKGYHIVVPLKPKADWATAKTFAHDFAQAMEQSSPERYTATLSKKARTGRIFIDYLRNGRGSTTVAPYSTRAKPGATISLPVTWKDVENGVGPADFSTGDAAKALKKADPWAGYDALRRPLKG